MAGEAHDNIALLFHETVALSVLFFPVLVKGFAVALNDNYACDLVSNPSFDSEVSTIFSDAFLKFDERVAEARNQRDGTRKFEEAMKDIHSHHTDQHDFLYRRVWQVRQLMIQFEEAKPRPLAQVRTDQREGVL